MNWDEEIQNLVRDIQMEAVIMALPFGSEQTISDTC